MRYLILIIVAVFSMTGFAKDMIQYDTEFKGLTVGVSSLADIVDTIGAPLGKIANSNNVKYDFDGFDITIKDTTGRINTIIVQHSSFSDPNGIKIGTRKSAIKTLRPHIRDDGNIMVDFSKGIIYWLEDEAVVKIVFPYQLPKQ